MSCTVHQLVDVFKTSNSAAPDAETVIRWCRVCGCVVGDIDIDGRASPGSVFKMIFPKGTP